MPHPLALPIYTLIWLPVLLPLALSFCLEPKEWRNMRILLRWVALLSALLIYNQPVDTAHKPEFGDDVAGNLAGAIYHTSLWMNPLGYDSVRPLIAKLEWSLLVAVVSIAVTILVGISVRPKSPGQSKTTDF